MCIRRVFHHSCLHTFYFPVVRCSFFASIIIPRTIGPECPSANPSGIFYLDGFTTRRCPLCRQHGYVFSVGKVTPVLCDKDGYVLGDIPTKEMAIVVSETARRLRPIDYQLRFDGTTMDKPWEVYMDYVVNERLPDLKWRRYASDDEVRDYPIDYYDYEWYPKGDLYNSILSGQRKTSRAATVRPSNTQTRPQSPSTSYAGSISSSTLVSSPRSSKSHAASGPTTDTYQNYHSSPITPSPLPQTHLGLHLPPITYSLLPNSYRGCYFSPEPAFKLSPIVPSFASQSQVGLRRPHQSPAESFSPTTGVGTPREFHVESQTPFRPPVDGSETWAWDTPQKIGSGPQQSLVQSFAYPHPSESGSNQVFELEGDSPLPTQVDGVDTSPRRAPLNILRGPHQSPVQSFAHLQEAGTRTSQVFELEGDSQFPPRVDDRSTGPRDAPLAQHGGGESQRPLDQTYAHAQAAGITSRTAPAIKLEGEPYFPLHVDGPTTNHHGRKQDEAKVSYHSPDDLLPRGEREGWRRGLGCPPDLDLEAQIEAQLAGKRKLQKPRPSSKGSERNKLKKVLPIPGEEEGKCNIV